MKGKVYTPILFFFIKVIILDIIMNLIFQLNWKFDISDKLKIEIIIIIYYHIKNILLKEKK